MNTNIYIKRYNFYKNKYSKLLGGVGETLPTEYINTLKQNIKDSYVSLVSHTAKYINLDWTKTNFQKLYNDEFDFTKQPTIFKVNNLEENRDNQSDDILKELYKYSIFFQPKYYPSWGCSFGLSTCKYEVSQLYTWKEIYDESRKEGSYISGYTTLDDIYTLYSLNFEPKNKSKTIVSHIFKEQPRTKTIEEENIEKNYDYFRNIIDKSIKILFENNLIEKDTTGNIKLATEIEKL